MILLLLFVFSGSAWAEELTSPLFELKVWTHKAGPIAICDLDYNNCSIVNAASFPCYQRMREAMKTLDDILKHRWVQTFAGVNAHETIFRALAEREQWDQTIKACVEGK